MGSPDRLQPGPRRGRRAPTSRASGAVPPGPSPTGGIMGALVPRRLSQKQGQHRNTQWIGSPEAGEVGCWPSLTHSSGPGLASRRLWRELVQHRSIFASNFLSAGPCARPSSNSEEGQTQARPSGLHGGQGAPGLTKGPHSRETAVVCGRGANPVSQRTRPCPAPAKLGEADPALPSAVPVARGGHGVGRQEARRPEPPKECELTA